MYFNPRSREGSDVRRFFRLDRTELFQSTLPRRERPSRCERKQRRWKFQSTLPRRERRRSMQSRAADGDFNPRSREGSDPRYTGAHLPRKISIHAPVKGATCGSRYHCRRDTISIHIECQIGVLGGDKQRVKQLFHSSIAPFRYPETDFAFISLGKHNSLSEQAGQPFCGFTLGVQPRRR